MKHQKDEISLWLIQNDLRLLDNQALSQASSLGTVLPVFIYSEALKKMLTPGSASKWWLHHSLESLLKRLNSQGLNMLFLEEDLLEGLGEILKKVKVKKVFWNKSYSPLIKESCSRLIKFLEKEEISWSACEGTLLAPPSKLLKKDGTPYLVYTAFWKNFLKSYEEKGLLKAPKLKEHSKELMSLKFKNLADLKLLPDGLSWDEEFYKSWKPGEEEALRKCKRFLKKEVLDYESQRNFPSEKGTSRLSPSVHFGEIHPHRVLSLLQKEHGLLQSIGSSHIVQYSKEILWREFAYHLFYHFPTLERKALKQEFKKFPWKRNKKKLLAWKKGKTGYPIVDAGMRELWTTGWMHNRVRMIVASFLVKHLNIPWQEGADYFLETLLDADLPNNSAGWQWVAGCGADAAPFFRIFNPKTQGEKFDKQGSYVKKWCPELKHLPEKWIHAPEEAPKEVLEKAGLVLGESYPFPIVDHKEARGEALWNYDQMRKKNLKK